MKITPHRLVIECFSGFNWYDPPEVRKKIVESSRDKCVRELQEFRSSGDILEIPDHKVDSVRSRVKEFVVEAIKTHTQTEPPKIY